MRRDRKEIIKIKFIILLPNSFFLARGRCYFLDHNTRSTTWQRPSTERLAHFQSWQVWSWLNVLKCFKLINYSFFSLGHASQHPPPRKIPFSLPTTYIHSNSSTTQQHNAILIVYKSINCSWWCWLGFGGFGCFRTVAGWVGGEGECICILIQNSFKKFVYFQFLQRRVRQ